MRGRHQTRASDRAVAPSDSRRGRPARYGLGTRPRSARVPSLALEDGLIQPLLEADLAESRAWPGTSVRSLGMPPK